MSRALRFLAAATTLALGVAAWGMTPAAQEAERAPLVVVVQLDDVIHPVSAEYLVGALAEAERRGAALFVLQINTPGGLDTSMRDIIQAMRRTTVPVCLYVGPQGARAASAGFFMAMAADVVAMAPRTNMGAASPVSVGGGEVDETMQKKLMQDAQAYIRSLAQARGRPADLAAEAVSDGRSFSAEESVELGLADFLASNVGEILAELAERPVEKGGTTRVLALQDADVEVVEMTLRQRILAILANPQVAYVLLLAGIAGLYFELSTPGAVLPGVLGGICLVLGAYALQLVPVDFAGLALMGLAVLFFILEVKVVSYGLLTVAGLVAFVLGSLMLFPGPVPEMRLSLDFVLPLAVGVALIAGFLLRLVLRTHRGRVHTGTAGLVSEVGRAATELGPGRVGSVFVHGERWRALSDVSVRVDEPVEVVAVESGMMIRVRPRALTKGN